MFVRFVAPPRVPRDETQPSPVQLFFGVNEWTGPELLPRSLVGPRGGGGDFERLQGQTVAGHCPECAMESDSAGWRWRGRHAFSIF